MEPYEPVIKLAVAMVALLVGVWGLLSKREAEKENARLRGELITARKDLQRLSDENAELMAKAKLKGTVTLRENKVYQARGDGGEDGPYCPRCWFGERNTLSPLLAVSRQRPDRSELVCAACREKVVWPPDPPGSRSVVFSG